MRGDQARKVCPEVQLVQVPTAHGKADLTLYRDAGKQVLYVPASTRINAEVEDSNITCSSSARQHCWAELHTTCMQRQQDKALTHCVHIHACCCTSVFPQ